MIPELKTSFAKMVPNGLFNSSERRKITVAKQHTEGRQSKPQSSLERLPGRGFHDRLFLQLQD
jgi:hypothetical protein